MEDDSSGLMVNRRRSARLMSKQCETISDNNSKKGKKATKTKSSEKTMPTVKENRKESLAARILRENNNTLKNTSETKNDNSFVDKSTAGETCESSESEVFFSSSDSADSDYDFSLERNNSRKSDFVARNRPLIDGNRKNSSKNLAKGRGVSRHLSTSENTFRNEPQKPDKKSSKNATKKNLENSDENDAESGSNYFAKFSTKFLTTWLDKVHKVNAESEKFAISNDLENVELPASVTASMKIEKNETLSSGEESDDADDWMEMERIDEAANEDKKSSVHVTIKQPIVKKTKKQLEMERWMKEIRLEIARRRRALFENMHMFHILSYIAHLRFHVSAVLESQAELATLLNDIIPAEILSYCPAAMDKAVSLFRPVFRLCSLSEVKKLSAEKASNIKTKKQNSGNIKKSDADKYFFVRSAKNYAQYLTTLISHKCFTSNLDLAVIFFAFCHCVLKINVRLCVSFNPMPKLEPKPEENLPSTSKEKDEPLNDTKTTNKKTKKPSTSSAKLMEKSKKEAKSMTEKRESIGLRKLPKRRGEAINYSEDALAKAGDALKIKDDETVVSPAKKSRKSNILFDNFEIDETELEKLTPRNYWVEFYEEAERRWICVDTTLAIVDKPKSIEKLASLPMLYVIGVDNEMGVREISAKYSSEFLTMKSRRLRIEQEWLNETLQLPILKADESRARAEDAQILKLQLNLDKPAIVSDYKNHPLYVLEKDLLKFEAIYPPDLEPLGTIRGYKIFPRSSVFTLQGELNWIKLARSVKPGEKPYKIVKARPKLNIPKEERVQLYLEVYGYWQTEPYVPPPVIDGKIPRNDYGNIYIYQNSMVPKGCVHLKLNRIMQVARKLDLEAVAAIVGWEFTGGKNHPTVDGCVVLEKDAEVLKKAWEEFTARKAERESKNAEERVWNNWKKLIKGKRLLEKMRSRFK